MFSLERDLNCNAAGLGAKGAREVCIHFKVGCHFSTVVRDALDRNFILRTMNHGYGRGFYFKTFRPCAKLWHFYFHIKFLYQIIELTWLVNCDT